jgi:N6-L-threonylcarbamoyladenine synthase
MLALGIETSCDETAVAVVKTSPETTLLLAEVVSSQIELHRPYGGVVPEMATREHLRLLPRIVPEVLAKAHVTMDQINAIAVTQGPGLASSLLIGHAFARAVAVAASKPIVGVNHLEGHLFSPFFSAGLPIKFPFLGLIASGGHTLLVHVLGWDRYIKMGVSLDDAAGEAFDKIARLLGLSYPGGPEIERMAFRGNPLAYTLPRSLSERDNLNFSFSGLKTAVRTLWEKIPKDQTDDQWLCDLAASAQRAIVDVLVRKALQGVLSAHVDTLVCSGGVMCNSLLRADLATLCTDNGIELLIADPKLCTDNARMIASIAAEKLVAGIEPTISDDIHPNLNLFAPEPEGDFNRSLRRAIQLKNRQSSRQKIPQTARITFER